MKKLSFKKMSAIGLIIAAVILSVVSWIVLPDTVITQIGIGGSHASTMSKPVAILIPAALSVLLSISVLISKNEDKKNKKALIVSVVGIAAFVIMLIVNR